MKKILNKSCIANDKKAYAILLLTTLLFCSVFIKAATIFSENMLLGTGTTAISAYTFQNSGSYTYTGSGDVRSSSASSGYTGASANGNVFLTNTVGRNFQIAGINTSGYSSMGLTFGQFKSTTASNGTEMVVEYSTDGISYSPLTFAARTTGTGTATWALITISGGTIPSTSNLRLRFTNSSATPSFRIDDIVLTGTPVIPVLSTSGTATKRTTTYGTASAEDSFSVSGTSVASGIYIAAPTGFEVSKTSGSAYKAIDTIVGSGTIASTPIYYRIKSGTIPGPYLDSFVITSSGATTKKIATAADTVYKKALTITGIAANNKTFDGTTSASYTGGTISGIVGSDVVTFSGAVVFVDSIAGTGKTVTPSLTLGGAQAAYYTLTQPTLTANINQASQTITFASLANKTVGDANFSLTATASSGLPVSYSGATPSVASVSGSTVTVGTAGTSVITASQAGNVNYSAATSVNQTQTVLSASLLAQTISFGPLAAVTYGVSPFALGATASSGLMVTYISLDTTVATISGSVITIKKPGTSIITASQGGDGTYAPAPDSSLLLTVNQKVLTISGASAASKTYDGNTTAILSGGSFVGVIGSDTVSFSGNGVFVNENIGTAKSVTGAYVLSGAQAARYTLTQPTFTADINPINLTIAGLIGNNRTYNGTTTATLSGTATLVGVLAGEVSNVVLGGTPIANFATPSIGTGIAITATGYSVSGSASGNYTLSQPSDLSANILGIPVTVVGLSGVNKTYDATTFAALSGTATLSGVLSSDSLNVVLGGSPTSSFATASVGTAKTITTTGYSISGSAVGNYVLSQPSATANITAKALTTAGAVAISRPYNGTTAATITIDSLVGVISPDVVTSSGGGTFTPDANVGVGKSVTASLTLGGAGAGNYTLTQPTGLSANITLASQTITFAALTSKTTSDVSFVLAATASSGLPVSYTSSNPYVATVSGSTVTIIASGTTEITASQGGDSNYAAAFDSTKTQVVTSGPIVAWDVNGYTAFGASPQTQTEKNSHVTVKGLTRGSGLTTTPTAASDAWGANGFNVSTTTAAAAITANDLVSFSIKPETGFNMSISSIPAYNIRRSGSGPSTGQWQYSINSGAFVDIGTPITWGSVTSASGNPQTAITLSGISALQNCSDSVTFRLVNYNATSLTGNWYFNTQGVGNDFQVNGTVNNGCTPATKLVFTTQPVVSANINQSAVFNVAVSAVCSSGLLASGLNTGTVSIDFSGCGLNTASTPNNIKTANIVNGIATFSGLSVSRSTQSGVRFTTTNTLSLTDTFSNSFNIIAPVGTSTNTTLKDDNFSAPAIAWGYTTSAPVTVGTGGSSGSDVSGIQTVSGNSFLRKSYSALNGADERGTQTTFTFDNVASMSSFNSTDFTFKIASSVGMSGSGAGNDVTEDLTIDISTDGGGTWTRILTHQGGSNKTFNFSSSSAYVLSPTANTNFTSSNTQSNFKVVLPSGTPQFRFRVTSTNNRSNESWGIDDVKLVANTVSGGVQAVLPSVFILGGDIVCGPPYSATLSSSIIDKSSGPVTYKWSTSSSLDDSTIASPTASPIVATSYNLIIIDSQGCQASSVIPAEVTFPTPNLVLPTAATTTSSGYCDAADGYRYYQVAGSSPAAYFFAIKWDADGDNVVDAAAKAASTVTVTVAGAPFSSTASSNEHGSVLMQRYWDVNVAGNTMTEPVDVKFYYDPIEKSSINATRDANKVAADLLTPFTLSDVPFSWFKTVGMPMNATAIAAINGNDFTPISALVLTDANTLSATDNSVLYAQFNNVMSFSGGTGGVGFAPYSGVSLPIELISFTALANNAQVDLKWITATEINNDFFSIERSKDGIHFEALSTQKGAGNSTETRVYTSVDNQPLSGISYYRLKQTDFDGQFSYSKIQSVNMVSISETMITHYPNPVEEAVKFVYGSNSNTTATYIVYDAVGKVVSEGSQKAKIGQNDLVINFATLSNGVYLIQMNIDGKIITEKFLKQ
jgi:hypothetical protein